MGTQHTPPNRARTLGVAGVVLGLLLLTTLGLAMWFGRSDHSAMVDRYNSLSISHRERQYLGRIAAGVCGVTKADGSASPLYKEAWRRINKEGETPEQLAEVATWLSGTTPNDDAKPNAPIPPECMELGIPATTTDPILVRLSPELCDYMARTAPALVLVRQASLQRDNRGPTHVWEGWTEPDQNIPSYIEFIQLSSLALIQGHIDRVAGRRTQQLERI
ncbi:MAG: hypothetical protein AAFX99_25815, partial [Myxococcota bacterium]